MALAHGEGARGRELIEAWGADRPVAILVSEASTN